MEEVLAGAKKLYELCVVARFRFDDDDPEVVAGGGILAGPVSRSDSSAEEYRVK